MNTRAAIAETMQWAIRNEKIARNLGRDTFTSPSLGWKHLCEMHVKIDMDPEMDEAKLSRWLGWMQCSIVSWGIMSLDEAKEINRRHS